MDPNSSCVNSSALDNIIWATFTLGEQLANVVITATFFGIATCLAIASVYILITRGIKKRSAALQLAAILILYTSTAVFFGAVLHETIMIMYYMEAAAEAITHSDFHPLVQWMGCVQTCTLVVNILVGDAVVWWRVYMLWAGVKARRGILWISFMLLAATFAISVVDTCGVCNITLSLTKSMPGSGALFTGTTFGVVAASMSLATNLVATCFTAYRAWVHVQSRRHFSQMLTLTGAEQILILVAESGFAYSAIWVVVVVWQGGENNENIIVATDDSLSRRSFWKVMGYFVNGGLVPVIAIYPMFIILMVALKRTCQTNGPHMLSTQIRFESQPASASPRPPTAQGGFGSRTHGLGLSRSSVIEASTSNSDLSMQELGKDVELQEGCLDLQP
ncbi:hypothetical protein K466DRAFT_604133 [Polyporus arcularius HHB13444]|uniref:G-protein coupled receptors family 1 profile domain-containing protein n=1 Tax=Polyporus arcularius HHB13444 TaxID=1314778 RepID=A0A5C3P7V8_9APHY|nr:hypothetical protein K466DRAFT_604133 [Polyporus arcularius HHB13444]